MQGDISDEGSWSLDIWPIGGLLMGTPEDGVLGPAFYLAGPCDQNVTATVGDEPSNGLAVADPSEREEWG